MKTNKLLQTILLIFIIVMTIFFLFDEASAQNNTSYMRIANVTVDSANLKKYAAALKEQMKAALQTEPGVLTYSAVYHKNDPAKITILETYESVAAYKAHIQTEHFKKYKATAANMGTSLELIDVVPIAVETKRK